MRVMKKVLAYLDGVVVDAREAKVSVLDRGFLFGDGVYEAGRSYDGCFLYLEEHWERIRSSCQKMQIDLLWSDEEFTEGLFKVAKVYGDKNIYFRTIITRGANEIISLDLTKGPKPTLVHLIQPLPAHPHEGISILTSKIMRNPKPAQDPNIKTTGYLNSLYAYQDIKARGAVEGIMCDANGKVTEGTNFSVFGVTADQKVITPSMDVGILDSITRRHVLAIAKKHFETEQGYYPIEVFHKCSEAFIVSSTREILPIATWDETKYPTPGPVTQKLHELFKTEIVDYVKSHPKF